MPGTHFILVTKTFACMCAKLLQSCLTLCDPKDLSLPGSFVHEILQAGILEWVAISYSRGSPQPGDQTWVSCIAGRFFIISATWEAQKLWGKNYYPYFTVKKKWDTKSQIKFLKVMQPIDNIILAWTYIYMFQNALYHRH